MKNIIVIGGSGFIGSHIVNFAIEQGHNVEVMDIKDNELDCNTIIRDIRKKDIMKFDFSPYDLVVMEAALTSQLEDSTDLVKTNISGLFNVLEACAKSKTKVAYASSSAVYGNTTDPVSEISQRNPINWYAITKTIGENFVNMYIRQGDFDGIILRYFNTYGTGENSKGNYKSIISLFLESITNEGKVVVYGDGTQRRDFIHVDDVARITLELGCRPEFDSGTYNIGSGKSISWDEILNIFVQYGLKFERQYVQNPIKDYQNFTQADISKLLSVGLKPETDIQIAIGEMLV